MTTPDDHNVYVSARHLQNAMTPETFANLGAPDLAYIRPAQTEQGMGWGIYTASGTMLGWAPERDLAFAAALQNDLMAVSVH
jgi:hypothetical protein